MEVRFLEKLTTNLVHIDFDRDIRPYLNDEPVWDAFIRIRKERDAALLQIDKWKTFRANQITQEEQNAFDYTNVCQERDVARVVARKLWRSGGIDNPGDYPWLEEENE